ncbi:putative quinol monooxygenase [Phyllobacterium sp. 0TCS1.6C]|uniref:putative quinol monooxygenase n=1 Tax=unclassified Phyllobacterium TaxID=2638441 RepID=UPI002264BCD4|nr:MULTISPECIES: putative quinol monooxygenase [unclassified Phyllobacterium]MCX8279168.1 putative quinol monooxygenase [Phyllobacterium sp. 0TCS1.6C]MCX8293952.1 putative quinol monooxygenase [Phyllobacterium sp. 0TCS1.6A]
MSLKGLLVIAASIIAPLAVQPAMAQEAEGPVIRIAELEIDPAQMAAYSAAVKEEMEESIRVEPGVLALYAVSIKGKPNHLRFFEMYADQAAYESHRESPHFRKYVDITKDMITSRKLFETDNFQLSARQR